MKKLSLIISLSFIVISSVSAQVTVVKRALEANPKLCFNGIAGSPEFSGYVESNLKNCGWFELVPPVNSDDAKYRVSGKVDNGKAYITVRGATSFTLAVKVNKKNLPRTAQLLVDAILKKLFNVPGICASRIAFVAQNRKSKRSLYV